MKVFFYPAGCADAARIQFTGNDGKVHNVLIDAGKPGAFSKFIKQDIQQISRNGETLDGWIVSHIHDDHIGGVLAYLDAVERGELLHTKMQWLYNSPRKNNAVLNQIYAQSSEAKSIRQGDRLISYLQFTDQLPQQDITAGFNIDLHGLQITVLSPAAENLARLHQKYAPENNLAFEREEDESISSAVSKKISDYHTPIDGFTYENWSEDNSIENASSIAVVTEYGSKKILWLADAIPSVVAESLRKLGYSKDNPFTCDLVKVSHHASSGNNSIALYQMIRCNHFLISADGENKYALPNKECLVTIMRHVQREGTCHFYYTHDNVTMRSIFAVDGDSFLAKNNVAIHFPETSAGSVVFDFTAQV